MTCAPRPPAVPVGAPAVELGPGAVAEDGERAVGRAEGDER